MCAKLAAPTGGSGLQITEIAPPGQYVAVCLRVNDLFDVERQKFQSQEMEMRDVTRFVFGLKDQSGRMFLIQTYEFTISGAPGSNLIKFLTAWLGQNPQMGWDYAEMLGKGAMITVQHKPSAKNPGQTYANISGISPVFQQLAHLVPNPAEFEAVLVSLERANPQSGAPAQPQPRPPGAGYPAPGQPQRPAGPAPSYGHPQPPPYQQPGAMPPPPPPPAPVAPPPPPVDTRPRSPDGRFVWSGTVWEPVPAPAPVAPPPPPAPMQQHPGFPPGTQFAPNFGGGQQPQPGQFVPPQGGIADEDVPF